MVVGEVEGLQVDEQNTRRPISPLFVTSSPSIQTGQDKDKSFTYLIWVSARSCPARRMGLMISVSGVRH